MILDILSSGGIGAIVGAIGSFLNKMEERKILKLKHAYNLADRELDLREVVAEQEHNLAMADKQMEQTELEGDIATDVAEVNAFATHLKVNAKATGIAFVDAIRGLMRPLITIYLMAMVTYIGYQTHVLVGGLESLPADELFTLYRDIIMSTIFLMTVAVTWWFGSRPHGTKHKV